MSDNWTSSDLHEPFDHDNDDDAVPRAAREGLPKSYRMRADRHYVDQLASPAGPVITYLALAQLDPPAPSATGELRALIESIRAVGIVHPILVRRHFTKYAVIAGHKRLAAAHVLRLATVPCIVREASDADADALATADNLTAGERPAQTPGPDAHAIRMAVEPHLRTIRRCADVLEGAPSVRPVLQMLQANAWRLDCLHRALELISSRPHAASTRRQHPIAAIVDEVVAGFRAEMALSGVTIKTELGEVPTGGFDEGELAAGLAGALMSTLPVGDGVDRATVTIKVTAAPGTLSFQIGQSDVTLSPILAQNFFTDDAAMPRPGGHSASIGARAARALAERHGGQAVCEVLDQGCRLTITLVRSV